MCMIRRCQLHDIEMKFNTLTTAVSIVGCVASLKSSEVHENGHNIPSDNSLLVVVTGPGTLNTEHKKLIAKDKISEKSASDNPVGTQSMTSTDSILKQKIIDEMADFGESDHQSCDAPENPELADPSLLFPMDFERAWLTQPLMSFRDIVGDTVENILNRPSKSANGPTDAVMDEITLLRKQIEEITIEKDAAVSANSQLTEEVENLKNSGLSGAFKKTAGFFSGLGSGFMNGMRSMGVISFVDNGGPRKKFEDLTFVEQLQVRTALSEQFNEPNISNARASALVVMLQDYVEKNKNQELTPLVMMQKTQESKVKSHNSQFSPNFVQAGSKASSESADVSYGQITSDDVYAEHDSRI